MMEPVIIHSSSVAPKIEESIPPVQRTFDILVEPDLIGVFQLLQRSVHPFNNILHQSSNIVHIGPLSEFQQCPPPLEDILLERHMDLGAGITGPQHGLSNLDAVLFSLFDMLYLLREDLVSSEAAQIHLDPHQARIDTYKERIVDDF